MQNNTALIALLTIVNKEMLRIFKTWSQTLLPPVITAILYFSIFGQVLGTRFGLINGFSYAQYIAPGLIMMAIINVAYSSVSGSYFISKFQRVIDELLIAPISVNIILCGYILGGLIHSFIVGLLVTMVAAIFTHLAVVHMLFMVAIFFLSGVTFALSGLINGLLATKFNDIMFIPTFILVPLMYLGGVFYQVSMLPAFWHHVSLFNPIFYLINAFRFAMIGYSEVNLFITLTIILACITVLYGVANYMLRNRIGVRF